MVTLLLLSLNSLLLWQHTTSITINCMSRTSSKSPSTAGSTTTGILCPTAQPYSMVSCGFKTEELDENDVKGSYIDTNDGKCYSKNGSPSTGVFAIARCCDLSQYQVSCNTYRSAASPTSVSNAKTYIGCSPTTQTMMGCSSRTNADRHNGNYPKSGAITWSATIFSNPDTCAAWAFETGSVWSYSTCCSSPDGDVTFICQSIWSGSSTSETVTVSCPNNDQFMTSCSGASEERNVNQWEIDDSNNQCIVRQANTGKKIAAIAICCSVTTTSPTPSPTSNPTPSPTNNPTPSPTDTPSKLPTLQPTLIPTTSAPTTVIPTQSPSRNPTSNPSKLPTLQPTLSPTNKPSSTPTIRPTTSPINDGSVDNINKDTPTKNPNIRSSSSSNVGANNDRATKNGLLGSDPLLDYLVYTVIGLVFIICILVLCMICMKQKRQHDREQVKKPELDVMEMISVNDGNAKTGVITNVETVSDSPIHTGELPVPPVRVKSVSSQSMQQSVYVNMNNISQQQQQQQINLQLQMEMMNMAMNAMPSIPMINEDNMDPNNSEYIEGVNGMSYSNGTNVASLISSPREQMTTKGDDTPMDSNDNNRNKNMFEEENSNNSYGTHTNEGSNEEDEDTDPDDSMYKHGNGNVNTSRF